MTPGQLENWVEAFRSGQLFLPFEIDKGWRVEIQRQYNQRSYCIFVRSWDGRAWTRNIAAEELYDQPEHLRSMLVEWIRGLMFPSLHADQPRDDGLLRNQWGDLRPTLAPEPTKDEPLEPDITRRITFEDE